MADEDEDGDFQEFASLLKAQPGGRFGQNFHNRHNIGGVGLFNRQRGRDRGFLYQKNGRSRGFCSSFEGHRDDFHQNIDSSDGFWSTSSVEEASSHFNNLDPEHHYIDDRFVHTRSSQFPNERMHGHGHGQQYSRFVGHGRHLKNNECSRGCTRNHRNGHGYHQHGVSGYENAENFKCFSSSSQLHPKYGKQGQNKIFVRSHGKMVGRGGAFQGSFKRFGANFGKKVFPQWVKSNKAFPQWVNSNKDIANVPSSVDVHVKKHDNCNGDGVDSKTCSKESLPAIKIDGSAPSIRKKIRKLKASSLVRSPLDAKHASQLPALINSGPGKVSALLQSRNVTSDIDKKHQEIDPEKEGTLLQGEDAISNIVQSCQEKEVKKEGTLPQERHVSINVDQRHRERAFIACIGGHNRKRQRSTAVRDFPTGYGSLRLSLVKKIKIKTIESKADAGDSTYPVRKIDSLSNLEIMNGNCSNASISAVHVDIVQVDPKDTFGDCSRTHATKRDGFAELVQSGGKLFNHNASRAALPEGDTSVEFVQASPKAEFKTMQSTKSSHRDLAEASLEVDCENYNEPVLAEKNDLFETVQIGPEGSNGDHTKTSEINKDYVTELVQSDLQVSNVGCVAMVESARGISCNGHCASQSIPHLAFESSETETPPQASAATTSMYIHTSSQGISCSVVKNKKKKTCVVKTAEGESSDGLLKIKSSHSKLDKLATQVTDTSMKLHNRGSIPKTLKVSDSSEITETSGALVPYQNCKSGGSVKNKDSGRRLIHKGSTRLKLFQTSKSLDSLMHSDPAKGFSPQATEGASARALVKRTLHEFESIRKALVKSQDAVRRADLDAASLLKERGKWRNCEEKVVGEVPGVEVGDQFSFRMEMLIIGLHRQVQSGIDYIPGMRRNNGAPLATSIVASGGYEDDKDDGNTLIYSGQGGNNNKGNKKQESNQELVRGNLALSNSMKEGTPVRVIRGMTDLTSPSSKIYTYDGLYDVIDFRFECGATGFGVYHFTLTRRPGQPQVGLSFLSNLKKKGLARPYLLLDDISRGQERLPVCVVNEVDEEPAPFNFRYIPKRKHPVWYSPLVPQGCNCIGVCDEETCSCAIKNGNELPYNEKGYIIRDKTVVYECGISCSCSSSCQNRVSQKGLRYRLEIFKTKNRGWGVRSLDPIQPGGFICEYTGELLTDAEAEQKVENDEYLFDLGNECNPLCDPLKLAKVDGPTAIVPAAEDVAYTIDAKDLGNVARFINHSCSPNLYAQNVLYDSDDLRFPHVMLFAMENIPPLRELTYDYNYRLDQVRDAHGNVKTKACYCGAQDCQGRLY